jgi:D-alanyl-D-alanine carboxypeptidase/D-alanyl-D-alanine-endopeptidase (penicillin-binding protein 4)
MARRSSQPLIVLTCLSITVAMALTVLWQWAATKTTVAAAPIVVAPADPTVNLTTPVLSLRRSPGVLSRRLNVEAFAAELQPVLDATDATSCSEVAVDGQVVAARNPMLPVIPASNMKVAVAAVALDVLGPSYTFATSAVGDLALDGVVTGDLALVGGGDPVLSTDWWPTAGVQSNPPINVTRLEDLADAVVAAGVTRVAGRVIGDGSRYDDEFFGASWDPVVQVAQAGPYDALLVNDGRMKPSGAVVATDPALGAAQLFMELLRERGVPVAQGAASGTAEFTTEIAAVQSNSLSAIIEEMLLTSDNNTAEMLVKEIGLVDSGSGTTAAGTQVIINRLLGWGIPIDGVVIADGSGLSRDDRLTCAALVGLLAHGSVDDPLGGGLPVAATSGTLSDVFVGAPVAGSLRAKTGTLSGVKALSGYLPVVGGSTIQFSIVMNTPGIDAGTAYLHVWQDLLAPALVTYPSAATIDQLAPR